MNNNHELVSVIMSTYNSKDKIKYSIESIINQSYKNIELLIVDDGSTDSTSHVVETFIKENKNIKLYKNMKNIGLTKSLNFLIKKSQGKYIARQDDDDISHLDRIKKQVELIERLNLDFCSSRAFTIDKNRKIPGFSFYLPKKLLIKYKNPFIHGSLLITKKAIDEIGGYDNDFYYSQDYKLMTELLNKGFKYKFTDEILYTLNTKNNISSNKKSEQKYYAKCVRKKIKPLLKI